MLSEKEVYVKCIRENGVYSSQFKVDWIRELIYLPLYFFLTGLCVLILIGRSIVDPLDGTFAIVFFVYGYGVFIFTFISMRILLSKNEIFGSSILSKSLWIFLAIVVFLLSLAIENPTTYFLYFSFFGSCAACLYMISILKQVLSIMQDILEFRIESNFWLKQKSNRESNNYN